MKGELIEKQGPVRNKYQQIVKCRPFLDLNSVNLGEKKHFNKTTGNCNTTWISEDIKKLVSLFW